MVQGSSLTGWPACWCGATCALRFVKNEGANQGRPFYGCGHNYVAEGGCAFFQWADDNPSSTASSSASSSFSSSSSYSSSTQHSINSLTQTFFLPLVQTSPENLLAKDPSLAGFEGHFDGHGVSYRIKEREKEVAVSFDYDATLISLFKGHVKGRRWNPATKEWTCPLTSFPQLEALMTFLGCVFYPSGSKSLKKASDEEEEEEKDGIRIEVHPLKLMCELEFTYDADLVNAIRQLHPQQRKWVPAKKKWEVDLSALSELVETFRPFLQQPSKGLTAIQSFINEEERGLLSSLHPPGDIPLSASSTNYLQTIRSFEENEDDIVKNEVDDDDDDDEEGRDSDEEDDDENERREDKVYIKVSTPQNQQTGPTAKVVVYDNRMPKVEEKEKERKEKDDEDDDDEVVIINVSAPRSSAPQQKPTVPIYDYSRKKEEAKPCGCGRPHIKINGVHICRYYGSFKCGGCGNRWTSAYTWEGETQKCRSCNREEKPWKKEQLQGGVGSGIQGPHDTARCGMCKRLGYDCSLRGSPEYSSYEFYNDYRF
ncbi:DNA topoisomerase 3 [Balamuthia mandrillaris]